MLPGHDNQAYDITGPEVMDFYQIAKIFSSELERDIKYTRPSAIKFVRQKLVDKKPLLHVLTLSLLYNAVRNGKMNYTNDVFRSITGHDPRHLADFIHEYRESWLKPAKKEKAKRARKSLHIPHI